MEIVIKQQLNNVMECSGCRMILPLPLMAYWPEQQFCGMGYWAGTALWDEAARVRLRPSLCRELHGD